MDDPHPHRDALPQPMRYELARIRDVIERILHYADSHFDLSCPTFETICGKLRVLEMSWYELEGQIVEHYLHGEKAPGTVSELLSKKLTLVKGHMFETFNILELAKTLELDGQEGAINALFLKEHYLSDEPTVRKPGLSDDKIIRIGNAIAEIVHEISHGSDWSKEFFAFSNVGEFCHIPYSDITLESPRLTFFRPKILKQWISIERQLRPRYVHTFATLADAPVEVDKHCDPVPGSACVVRKVCHKRTGESLAMKTYSSVFSSRLLKAILQEIGILEVCAHPNIVKLSEAFRVSESEHDMHLVLSPWAPCTLERLLIMSDAKKRHRCPWLRPGVKESDQCVHRIMLELSDALIYLHERSIKHKDLKPANILLQHEHSGETVTPLITDVGVSKIQISAAKTGYDDSTYQYLAPEQHDHVSSTLQSDVWQLGCCFAELLAMARGGSAGWWQFHNSFQRDDDNECTFTIAKEHSYVTKALANICLPGNPVQERVYEVVMGMLDLCPSSRLEINAVRAELDNAVFEPMYQSIAGQFEPPTQMGDLSLS